LNTKVSKMTNKDQRSGSLKQSNKTHKTGGHRSKGAVDAVNRGRIASVSSGGVNKAKNAVQSKIVKKNKIKQLRQLKCDQILEGKKAMSSGATPPILVVLIPLVPFESTMVQQINSLLEKDTSGDWIIGNDGHIQSPQKFRRRFHFVQPTFDVGSYRNDMLAIYDATKVCDSVVYIVDESSLTRGSEKLISGIAAQGTSTSPVFVLNPAKEGLEIKKKQGCIKSVKEWLHKTCPNATEKIFQLGNDQQAVQLLRHLGDQKKSSFNSLRSNRAHVMAEKVDWIPAQNGSSEGTLKITGYIRGDKINVNRLIHIPGWKDFQLEKIEKLADPQPFFKNKSGIDINMSELAMVLPSDRFKDDLVSENVPDPMDGEQNITEEDMLDAELGTSIGDNAGAGNKKKRLMKVPKGTSEYQASWILDNGEENDEDLGENDENGDNMLDVIEEKDESESESSDEEEEEDEMSDGEEGEENVQTEESEDNYDEKHVKFAEEQETYSKIKEARQDEMFPDEVDTPMDQLAKDRFQKYRGLKSFRSSPWDPKENLPCDYARIFQFENFQRTRKNVLAANNEEGDEYTAEAGTYCNIYVQNVDLSYYKEWSENPVPLVVFSMLKHENKMSVMNVAVKKIFDQVNVGAIPSKERLIFHVGYRRFAAKPIFSAHTNGSKHKYERFWRENEMIVMSMFAPIMYPPANVLVYRELSSGRQSLLGTGNLLSMTPDRLVIKRGVLSGHPFKVHTRSATVRFLFFNRQDIEWFKPVELSSNYGRRGHIKEALGTHGHMKVVMDKPISQQDTILMNLYKRVYPKWNYDPNVTRYVPEIKTKVKSSQEEIMDIM